MTEINSYDAILVVSFGGPEGRDDVIPFLENVTKGRNIPRERLLGVAEHYYQFDGVSPINQQCRDLISALRAELDQHDIKLPIFWGNRNWTPYLTDQLAEMKQAGVKRALAYVTSAFSSWSSCRQYLGNIQDAQAPLGQDAPAVDKIRAFYNHPDFINANCDVLAQSLAAFSNEERASVCVAFTAHSIPNSMADHCDYEKQLKESCRLVTERLEIDNWQLVYQSRSGRPQDPWLEPDILDHMKTLKSDGVKNLIIAPIGFLSDHMEVLYDLDCEAKELAKDLEMKFERAATVGTHPSFISMIRQLIQERLDPSTERPSIGQFGANHDACPTDCCPLTARPAV
jgi:protoporphyrin/coproporphyrin ferrochelatase